ncbi:hypothetical protein ACJX0J_021825, partial [Zea mays]
SGQFILWGSLIHSACCLLKRLCCYSGKFLVLYTLTLAWQVSCAYIGVPVFLAKCLKFTGSGFTNVFSCYLMKV